MIQLPTRVRDRFIQLQAERKFKKAVFSICQELTPDHIERMAKERRSLDKLLAQTGRTVRKPTGATKLGVEYLMAIPHERIMALLEEVVPEHVAVLRKHPVYTAQFTNDLKSWISGLLTNP